MERERQTDQRQETAGKAVEGVEGKDGIQIEGEVGGKMEERNVGTRRHKGGRG